MVATFAVLGIALDSQTDIVDTGKEVADTGLKKQQEDFVITSAVQAPGNYLQIHLKNNGPNPSEIFTVVMTNSSDIANGFPATTIDIPSDTSFLPPGTDEAADIVKTLNLKMKTPASGTDNYKFKVISSLGNIEKFNLVCDSTGLCAESIGGVSGTGDLAVQLFLDGPNGVNTKISTVIMFVSNTGDGDLKEIWPDVDCPTLGTFPSITHAPPTDNLGDFTSCTISPAIDADPDCGDGVSGACLIPGQTMIFKWDGVVSGDVGDVFNFCNSVTGKQLDDTSVSSNIDCDSLTVIDPNDCGGCEGGGEGGETIILLDDLLIRPSIFLTIPSPFGTSSGSDETGVWGVNIANPTNSTITVSKVTITAFPPGANENTQVFDPASSAGHENINPPGAGLGDWVVGNIGSENVAVWKNFENQIVLDPYSNESFLLKVKPDNKNGQWEAIIVQASVFSSSGSFGKAGYQTTMFGDTGTTGNAPIANVYLTNATDSRDISNVLAHRDDITNGTLQQFSVLFADMDDDTTTAITKGAKLIVNVPRDWEDVSVHSGANTTNFEPNPAVTLHGDGTYQIVAITDTHLGNGTNPNTATLSFEARAPNERFENMHIMYVLGDGISDDGESIGPLSEVVLHVIGNQTGYP